MAFYIYTDTFSGIQSVSDALTAPLVLLQTRPVPTWSKAVVKLSTVRMEILMPLVDKAFLMMAIPTFSITTTVSLPNHLQ